MAPVNSRPRRGGNSPADDEEQLWAAIADPSRRRLLDLLVARGDATPTVLARELPFTRQAAAKHLSVLERAGLVESRREGREVHYVVGPERLAIAVQSMMEAAARWDQRLATIKSIAEAIHRAKSACIQSRSTHDPRR